jgi:heptosyltransferase-2
VLPLVGGLRYKPRVRPRRIFVRAPNWVGDLVMATPAFARIRAGYPDAHITVGLRPYLRTLLDGNAWFDEVVDLPKSGALGLWRQARALRRSGFDLAIVLPNSPSAGLLALLAGIPVRLGYRQGRPLLMNMGLRAPRARRLFGRGPRRVPSPMPRYYHALLDLLGLPPGGERGELAVTADERERCDRWFAERGVPAAAPVVAMNAGASFGASKMWEPRRFARVASALRARGYVVVLLSGPGEVDTVRAIAAESGALAAIDPILPVGMLKPMIQRAALLVTTDSGPRHVAVAFDVPVVCLIGPTDSRYTDYCLDKTILLRKDLDCVPCQKKVCPLGHHDCMNEIAVDEVLAAADRLLAPAVG